VSFPGPAVVTVHEPGLRVLPRRASHLSPALSRLSTRHNVRRATRILADPSLATPTHRGALSHSRQKSPWSIRRGRVARPGAHRLRWRQCGPLPAARGYLTFVGTLQRARTSRPSGIRRGGPRRREDVGLVLAGPQGWLYDPRGPKACTASCCPLRRCLPMSRPCTAGPRRWFPDAARGLGFRAGGDRLWARR